EGQIVDETEQIEEEGIAANPGEESVFASRRDVGPRTERGRRARDHRPSSVVEPSSQGALRQVNGGCLGAILNLGESDPERSFRTTTPVQCRVAFPHTQPGVWWITRDQTR